MTVGAGAGRIWEVLRCKVDSDIADWLNALPDPRAAAVAVLEGAFDAYRICDPPPIEDLPPRSMRVTLTLTVPIGTHAMWIWWGRQKEVPATSILRALLREAFEDYQILAADESLHPHVA